MRLELLSRPTPPRAELALRPATGSRVLLPDIADAELVERVARGDGWAEEVVYRRHAPAVIGVARRLLASQTEAEDVAQDTFVTAFEIWGQLRDPHRLKQWLIQIAVRKVHRIFRRRRLLRVLGIRSSENPDTLEQWAHPTTNAEVRAELALLDKALHGVTPAQRIAWMLRYVEGMSLDEVAFECSCSLATAKRRIAAAQAAVGALVHLEVPHE
ncbi:MAG: sigma-70 family RNA polymerase sigma factor [Myxococcales bacterium]|jgi:RNA polymerase sigma-70 factor (ECF subfamily)|nr:sigma-70 family RNA polymerase sigma factor [Myxococcales bacterium]